MDSRQTRSAGCQQVVRNDNPHAGSDGILVYLKGIHPILQLIADTHGFRWKFGWLSNWNETGSEVIRQGRSENESPGFDAEHNIRAKRPDLLGEGVDDLAKS